MRKKLILLGLVLTMTLSLTIGFADVSPNGEEDVPRVFSPM